MPVQSLFERRDTSSSHCQMQPVLGELVFGKFAEMPEGMAAPFGMIEASDDTNGEADPVSGPAAVPELDQAVVDEFFVNDDAPMFELDDGASGAWPSLEPLFGEDEERVAVEDVEEALKQVASPDGSSASESVQSVTPLFAEPLQVPLPTPSMEEAELPVRSSGKVGKKTDRLGVVSYKRKSRSSPLTPVVCESDDPIAVKRARNTEAARRSRARKLMRMNQLEEKVEELLERNQQLESEVAILRARLGEA